MNLGSILKTVGTGILTAAFPAAAPILGVVNQFLPDEMKLPDNATGTQIATAVDSLSSTDRAALMAREFDVEETQIRESYDTVRTMLESDAANPHSTRPRIALGAFHVVAFAVVVIVSAWAYGVLTDKSAIVTAVVDGWPFILAVLAPLVTLLYAYFGVLKQEHKQRMDAANGSAPPAGIAGLLTGLLKR